MKTNPAIKTLTPRQERWRERYGPWAVVTGASDGIGREFAVWLASMGMNLVLVARRGEVLSALATKLRASDGIDTRVIAADLGRAEEVQRVVTETQDLDVGLLVAAAGFGTSGSFLEANLDEELSMVDVNCRAVVAMSLLFGRRLARRGRGGLVLMSSLLAFQGTPRAGNYAATKAYVQTLAEALRIELGPLGVDVVACAPGPIRSGFAARANMRMSMAASPEIVAAATLESLGNRTTVRPGLLSKLLEYSLAMLPRWGRVRVMSLVMGGMTNHQNDEAKAQTGGPA
jgi:short-subunit dehydrogenase